MSDNLINNFIRKLLNNEETTVGRKLMLISLHEIGSPYEKALIEGLYIAQGQEPALNFKMHDCAVHGHIPVGWTSKVYCEICGEFLYEED